MRSASLSDKELVIDIIAQTMNENRGTTWMLKSADIKHLKNLAQYAFYKAYYKKGAYISSNNKGLALCFKFNTPLKSITPIIHEIIFFIKSVKISSIPKILKLEAYKKKQRPAHGEYLYFWFFSTLKGCDNAGYELKNEIFNLSKKKQLPIYAETSRLRNKIVYEYFGFKTYHYFEDKNKDLQYWFMKWESQTFSKVERFYPV